MSNDDVINSLPSVNNGYNPVQVGVTPDATASVGAESSFANRPRSSYVEAINKNVGAGAQLLGPSNPDDPTSSALNARAKQMYETNLNATLKNAAPNAQVMKMNMQQNDINNRAALYTNAQSRAQLNYQQIAYQRQFAVQQAMQQRQMLSSIFEGTATVATFAGVMAFKGGQQNPVENIPQTNPTGQNIQNFYDNNNSSSLNLPSLGSSFNTPNNYSLMGDQ